jgi:hypothetical protein
MPSTAATPTVSRARLWTGRILTAIPILLLVFSGVMKLIKPAAVVQGFARYGFPEGYATIIGVLELTCVIVYAIPRTSVLGAILMAGYLGGATVTEVRIESPTFFIPFLLAVFAWAGLYFRDERVKALIPLRQQSPE